ncbi:hypothetical protein [Streptomyces sp. NBC_01262]|uniref:hypothetical protein n=1 Tax=Streptomyces sp. NBC_01262 TaxID=2903803 RepID=UPI002E2FA4D7|nr:hypothetical protein [Streptomyces sp. NBC_01262]
MTLTPPLRAPTAVPGIRSGSLDDLYPDAAWDLPVNPALPAPRLPHPPPEQSNPAAYRAHYHPFIVEEFAVPGAAERIAVIDKAFPHSLYDLMLLVARDDILRTSVADTPDPALAGLLRAAATFTTFVADPATVRAFGLDDSQFTIGWNHDPTLDRDNGQWWDKRLHLHLNCWPATVRSAVRPVALRDITDATMRRSLVDPAAYLAHQVMADALTTADLPAGCTVLAPDPCRDAAELLPVGLKIRIPGWPFITTTACRMLLRTLHQTATMAYRAALACFTGTREMPGVWQRPQLLPSAQLDSRLAQVRWLSPAGRCALVRLREVLRDVTATEMQLLRARPDLANRCLSLGGLSYNLTFFTPRPISADTPQADPDEVYVVMQLKVISYVGHSPAVGGAVASVIDRHNGPVMAQGDRARRHAFQHAFVDQLRTHALA